MLKANIWATIYFNMKHSKKEFKNFAQLSKSKKLDRFEKSKIKGGTDNNANDINQTENSIIGDDLDNI